MSEYQSGMKYFFGKTARPFQLFKDYIAGHSRLIIRNVLIIIILFLVVFVSVGFLVFWIIRQGRPEVSVPKVTEKDLVEGLLILQKKNLRALIDPRYFSDYEKNMIVEQDPRPGSVVREGKDVRIIVSKGPIISIVEDYSGKTVTFVQNRLQEILSFQGKTIRVGTITSVAADEPPGTIVGQFPPPNTPITNVDTIDLVVSKGSEIQAFYLEDYSDADINEVMQMLALRGVLVHVVPEEVIDPAQNGLIISQDPPEGSIMKRNETVTFYVGYLPSEKGKDKLYARVLNFDVPPDIERARIRILIKDRIGEREIYNEENAGGDSLSIPFKSYSDTTAYIYIDGSVHEMRKIE
jgi:beta-lactam-binding protein with PASTA domain